MLVVEEFDPENQKPSPHFVPASPLLRCRERTGACKACGDVPVLLGCAGPATAGRMSDGSRRELILTVRMSGCWWIKQGD